MDFMDSHPQKVVLECGVQTNNKRALETEYYCLVAEENIRVTCILTSFT